MKNLILIISSIVLISCNNKKETIVEGNVFNIAENENWPNPKIDLYKTSGGVETTTSKVIKSVNGDNLGNFEFSFSSTNNHPYSIVFDDITDEVMHEYGSFDGIHLGGGVTVGQTNTIQLHVASYSFAQMKVIQDSGYDSINIEISHVNIDSYYSEKTYINEELNSIQQKTPSGPRVYKTIKYLNGVETINIDTMDFEPMQTYNLEFHY